MKATKTKTKTKTENKKITDQNKILGAILEELRILRQELALFLPQEELEDFAHAKKIKNSYQKAIKQYPPLVL